MKPKKKYTTNQLLIAVGVTLALGSLIPDSLNLMSIIKGVKKA